MQAQRPRNLSRNRLPTQVRLPAPMTNRSRFPRKDPHFQPFLYPYFSPPVVSPQQCSTPACSRCPFLHPHFARRSAVPACLFAAPVFAQRRIVCARYLRLSAPALPARRHRPSVLQAYCSDEPPFVQRRAVCVRCPNLSLVAENL